MDMEYHKYWLVLPFLRNGDFVIERLIFVSRTRGFQFDPAKWSCRTTYNDGISPSPTVASSSAKPPINPSPIVSHHCPACPDDHSQPAAPVHPHAPLHATHPSTPSTSDPTTSQPLSPSFPLQTEVEPASPQTVQSSVSSQPDQSYASSQVEASQTVQPSTSPRAEATEGFLLKRPHLLPLFIV
ncbi:hypothetical protein L1987_06966 [Smallanthus sonchifolius]|uniref:Uncharacterized protein n=1 Tax=Smallanthus sonchifolius TaxID=185202 RepID=A0ACB9JZR5_9ASTR|nr:hypothetical protein L1987_06966 [Smallanthus sonchifolius]